MIEKETKTKPLTDGPTKEELNKVLRGIESKTIEKEERERQEASNRGIPETLEEKYEEKFKAWKREQPRISEDVANILDKETAAAKSKKEAPAAKAENFNLADYIKENFNHNDYTPKHFNADNEISNLSEVELSIEFIDYLLGEAMAKLEEKGAKLGDIVKIQIRVKDGIISLFVRDLVEFSQTGGSSMFFKAEPPFPLEKIDSHLGYYIF